MSKMKKGFYLALVTLFASAMMSVSIAASDPVNMLNSVANQLIAKLKANQTTIKTNPSLVYSFANQIVVPHADIDVMAKKVLPPQIWNGATAEQRSRFKREFTTLLVHTYASALANYTDQTVKFFPIRGGYQGRSTVQVSSEIERPDGPPVSVSYSLLMAGSQWKLYDMSVEGVSMLESFRSQFADQLSRGDMESVIKLLGSHNSSNSGSSD
ncbi:MAG: ABC transporter substrate-binding protein [Gammaproteobacteria bacterium]|nr:ABC transporter substrate-binding protein [Gammaproteobacteria bacterium]